jgi:hypothetical protein
MMAAIKRVRKLGHGRRYRGERRCNGGTYGAEVLARIRQQKTYFYEGTPLGVAATSGSPEIVQALLSTKSYLDVNAEQPGGHTPLTLASMRGRADVVRLLLAAKADLNAANKDGKTALTLASENDRQEVVELLTAAGAAISTVPGGK